MSYTAEQLSEREFALREAEANDAEERYFEARPVDDGAMHRRSFRAGFERAWFTRGRAHAAALEELAALREQVAERDAELDSLRRSIVAAIDGKPCPTPAQWIQMQAIIRAAYPKED